MKKARLLWKISKKVKEELRQEQFRNGTALENHIRSVHNGEEQTGCPACQEIRRRENASGS